MGLNLSNGNMYKFVNYTWNPIKGKCLHDCSYCYMKTMPQYQHLILAENEFKTDLGNGNRIFIGSTTDAFAENVPSEWIVRILDYCYQNHNAEKPNAYLLQSKNPKRFLEFINHPIMERVIFGTNTTYLSNAVNNYFGCNFKQLLNKYRVEYAKSLLLEGTYSTSSLFRKCGFASQSVFYAAFHKVVGASPLQFLYKAPSKRRKRFKVLL